MSRPPNTQSLATILGSAIEAPAYADLSDRDIDRLIIKCRRAIHSHRRDALSGDVQAAEDALAAIDSVKAILADLLALAPLEKRPKIATLIEHG